MNSTKVSIQSVNAVLYSCVSAAKYLIVMLAFTILRPLLAEAQLSAAQEELIKQRLGVSRFTQQQLHLPTKIQSTLDLDFQLSNIAERLLFRRMHVQGEDSRSFLVNGTELQQLHLPTLHVFKLDSDIMGHDQESFFQSGVATVIAGGLHALLYSKNESFVLLPASWLLQTDRVDPRLHILYSLADLTQDDQRGCQERNEIEANDDFAGVHNHNANFNISGAANSGSGQPSTSFVTAEIGAWADWCFWSQMPGPTDNDKLWQARSMMALMIADSSLRFRAAEMDLHLGVTAFDTIAVNCAQVSSLTSDDYLDNLRRDWPAIVGSNASRYAGAHAFISRPWSNESYAGQARRVGSLCDETNYYAASNLISALVNGRPNSAIFRMHQGASIVNHELGHISNAVHCGGDPIFDPQCSIMQSTSIISGQSARFDPSNLARMNMLKSTVSCLTSGYDRPAIALFADDFSAGLNFNYWASPARGVAAVLGGVQFYNPGATNAYDVGQLTTNPLSVFRAVHDENVPQVTVSFRISGPAANSFSTLQVLVLDTEHLWQPILAIRPHSIANNQPITVTIPSGVIDPNRFAVRFNLDLAANDSIVITDFAVRERVYKSTAQAWWSDQVVVDDLDGDNLAELITTDASYYGNLGVASIYSKTFTGARVQISPDGGGRNSFGSAVAVLSDVNNDGFKDLLVGADNAGSNLAESYVDLYSGLEALRNRTTALLWRSYGPSRGEKFGASIAEIGDANADGISDLIVGAPLAGSGSSYATGAVYVLSGANGAIISRISGERAGDQFGCVMDSNKKFLTSFDPPEAQKFVVGMCGASAPDRYVHVYQGLRNNSGQFTLIKVERQAAVIGQLPGVAGDPLFGSAVRVTSNAVAIGMPGIRYDASNVVVSGGAIMEVPIDTAANFRRLLTAPAQDLNFGSSIVNFKALRHVATSGVFMQNDLLVSAPKATYAGAARGAVFQISRDNFQRQQISGPVFVNSNNSWGKQVATGDLDGDGAPDIAIGAHFGASGDLKKTHLYLSRRLGVVGASGVGGGMPNHNFGGAIMTAYGLDNFGSTQNSSLIFEAKGISATANMLYPEALLLIGRSTTNLPASVMLGANIVVPDFVLAFPNVAFDAAHPDRTLAAVTLALPVGPYVRGTLYYQLAQVSWRAGVLDAIYPKNIVRVNH